jgi:fatty acid desaturase
MSFFRYKEDRIPVALIVSLFLCDLAVYFTVESRTAVIAWAVVALYAKLFTAAWNHHHQHVNTFSNVYLNRLLEIVYTFHTGVTTNVWVLHHNLGHHVNYLDQTKDESGWQRKDGTTMGILEYTVVIALTGYYRANKVLQKHPKYRNSFVGMGLANLCLLGLLLWFNPFNAAVVFVAPMLTVYIGTCWVTYFHHAGLETEDHLHASRNITNRAYNIISGNLGYHTAHHMKQGLHWSKLPEYHATIADKIPPELISTRFPFLGMR